MLHLDYKLPQQKALTKLSPIDIMISVCLRLSNGADLNTEQLNLIGAKLVPIEIYVNSSIE